MALSAARDLPQSRGEVKTDSGLMAASTTIYAGGNIMRDANGLLVPAAIGAGNSGVVGVALETVTSDASTATYINYEYGEIEQTCTGMAQARVGEFAYCADDETMVADSAAATNAPCGGQITRYTSATKVFVNIVPEVNATRGPHS